MERSDGGSSLVQSVRPDVGSVHTALYASKGGKQLFFLDGQLVLSHEETHPINATHGYVCDLTPETRRVILTSVSKH